MTSSSTPPHARSGAPLLVRGAALPAQRDEPGPVATTEVSSTVSADPSGCTEARRWTSAQLPLFGIRSTNVRADVELLVSELVSNAVQHGSPPVVVSLRCDATGLTVSVADTGGPPHQFDSRPPDPTAARGRGLALVASIAATWGIRSAHPGPGKTVWCRVHHDVPELDR